MGPRDLVIDGIKVFIPDTYPRPNDKIVFRYFSQDFSNNAIRQILNNQPGIHVKSAISPKLSPFRTGDWFV